MNLVESIEGHVFEVGGVMCMELLLKQGWSAAYTVETLILQVAATLVRGQGRVDFAAELKDYSLAKALVGLKQLKQLGNGAWTSKHSDG
jgi:ubiquitin-conjugating enzyme E2 Q